MMRKMSLRAIYAVVFLAVLALASIGFVAFDLQSQRMQSEEVLLEEARTFSREMDAVWQFMYYAQDTINYETDGSYEFKGLHCAVVGKGVGALFSKDSNYAIRYTNFNPRNPQDVPDEFESKALDEFSTNPESNGEYYAVADYEGEERFRYVKALEVEESCLECHGQPVGELDITGHAKEGWEIGDVGGAISIVIPLDQQNASMRESVTSDITFFIMLAILVLLVVFLVTTLFVFRPLSQMRAAFDRMRQGDLSPMEISGLNSKETDSLISNFNAMACELNTVYEHLEDQVSERTQQLTEANEALKNRSEQVNALNEKLSAEVQFKSDILAMVNHELRTPLTAIITRAIMSREDCEREGRGVKAEEWREIEISGNTLLDMINNMLDIARSDAGVIVAQEEPMDLGDIVASAKATLSPLASKYHVILETNLDSDVPLVYGDYEKTQRIVNNLISNAIKFTPDDGYVRVHVRCNENGEVEVIVEDSGIGIAVSDQQRIFERFVQVDNTSTRKYNGSGLGLTIAKEYAELQGYRLSVDSRLGKGSKFILVVPRAHILD